MITRIREDQIPADNAAGYTTVALIASDEFPGEGELMRQALLRPFHDMQVRAANVLAIEVDGPTEAETRERVRAKINKLWQLD